MAVPSQPEDGYAVASPVTVVIVTFNSGATIFKCLEALSQQTVKPSKVIVVDNASSDQSVALMIKQYPSNEYWQLTENLGFAAGNNRAIEKCSTEFVALLNPDAYPQADWLARLIDATARYPQAASFGSRQLSDTDANVVDGVGDVYHFSGLVWRNGHGRPQILEDLEDGEIFSPCAGAALYRLCALKEVGGFDADFFCYVEDIDLGFRLRLAGWKSMYVANAVVKHVGGATTGGKHSSFSLYHGHRNLVWTFVKNMPSYLFWAFLPGHILLNVATVVWFALKGQGPVILEAKWDAIKNLGPQLGKRRQIQRHRKATVCSIFSILNKGIFR